MPSVQYLNCFFLAFCHENLLLLMRDGRDVVTSTKQTCPRRGVSLKPADYGMTVPEWLSNSMNTTSIKHMVIASGSMKMLVTIRSFL